MHQTAARQKILTGLIVLTLCFIWGNSLMPGTISGAISDWVGAVLSRLFGGAVDTTAGHGVLRKLAHGTEYLVLGVELTLLLRLWQHRPWSLLALCGMSTALFDETIQLFVAGRSGQIRDVWIDLGGFCAGVLLAILVEKLRTRKCKKT